MIRRSVNRWHRTEFWAVTELYPGWRSFSRK